jgi:hypothetical protein
MLAALDWQFLGTPSQPGHPTALQRIKDAFSANPDALLAVLLMCAVCLFGDVQCGGCNCPLKPCLCARVSGDLMAATQDS